MITGESGADRGAATVWAAGGIAVLMTVAVFGLHLGAAMVARHHAESAADLAALAGAGALVGVAGEQQACALAHRVTDRMRSRLMSCSVHGWDVLVQVTVHPGGALGGFGDATARARAGPAGP
ncbi:MAG TPA: Rv3654c family TadE-like protein [Pseudonocardiaceae bacterium]